jgi:hypothetical protein
MTATVDRSTTSLGRGMKYTHTLAARQKLREEVMPSARDVRDRVFKMHLNGEADVQAFLSAQSDYNEVVQLYLETAIRHRRAALALNTAIGKPVGREPP